MRSRTWTGMVSRIITIPTPTGTDFPTPPKSITDPTHAIPIPSPMQPPTRSSSMVRASWRTNPSVPSSANCTPPTPMRTLHYPSLWCQEKDRGQPPLLPRRRQTSHPRYLRLRSKRHLLGPTRLSSSSTTLGPLLRDTRMIPGPPLRLANRKTTQTFHLPDSSPSTTKALPKDLPPLLTMATFPMWTRLQTHSTPTHHPRIKRKPTGGRIVWF